MKWIVLAVALVVLVNLIEASNIAREDVAAGVRDWAYHWPQYHLVGGSASLTSQPFILCLSSLLATGVFLLMAKKNQ